MESAEEELKKGLSNFKRRAKREGRNSVGIRNNLRCPHPQDMTSNSSGDWKRKTWRCLNLQQETWNELRRRER